MAIDLFKILNYPDEQLHPSYLVLRDAARYVTARDMLQEIQAGFDDADGNFVEQFQTTGFDARTFEIFLHALFNEAGHLIDRSHARPDFMISKDGISAAVEAVTAGHPSNDGIKPYFAIPDIRSQEELRNYLRHNVPVRIGSPLFSKKRARYWDLAHVAGKPFVIAIQDFHEPGSLARTSTTLSHYLYGLEQHWYHDKHGKLIITEHKLDTHNVGVKQIPSGFFFEPESEHISAVMFSNSGTVAKFSRMGQEGSHYSKGVRMLRWGTSYRHDPNASAPDGFLYEVGNKKQVPETWGQGNVLIHNPNAKFPLPRGWFGACVEEELIDGRVVSTFREEFHPYFSLTELLPGNISWLRFKSRQFEIRETLRKMCPNRKLIINT